MQKKESLIVLLILLSQFVISQNYRYTKTIFGSSTVTSNIQYATAPSINNPYSDESATTATTLSMDVYQPTGDILTNRPVIIFAHGGGFADGNKNVDDMTAFCDTFARKGYVTVSINYRQGVEVADNGDLHYTRAAYRGLQDGRSAIRFLRANASTYGIDPNKIYWGGNSAGSFIGLNSIFIDDNEKPADANAVSYSITVYGITTNYSGPDLGNLDIGENLSESGMPNAVMACWGGVADTLAINTNNNIPVFLIHGTADQIVPFNSGPPFNLTGISPVYGSNSIETRLNTIGLAAQMTYFVPGQDHEFYGVTNGDWTDGSGGNEYWDTVVTKATKFYWLQHKPTADYSYISNNLDLNFTDASLGAETYLWNFGDGATSTEQNPQHTFATTGVYDVTLYIENEILSWDTISYNISVDTDILVSEINSSQLKIYPNPSSSQITIDNKGLIIEKIQLLDITGRLVKQFNNPTSQIQISDLEKGTYILKIQSANRTITKQIIKK